MLVAQHEKEPLAKDSGVTMHRQKLKAAPSGHDGINIVKNKVHRAIDTDDVSPHGLHSRRFAFLSLQIALISAFQTILKAVFSVVLRPVAASRAMFRPFRAGPPT